MMRWLEMLAALLMGLLAAQLFSPSAASAQVDDSYGRIQLKGEALREAYLGQTHDLVYQNPQGILGKYRHLETHNPDGSTKYVEGGQTFVGQWWLKGDTGQEDTICFRYPTVDPERQHCFIVFMEGRCIYSYSVRFIFGGKPIDEDRWNSKGSNIKDGDACHDRIS